MSEITKRPWAPKLGNLPEMPGRQSQSPMPAPAENSGRPGTKMAPLGLGRLPALTSFLAKDVAGPQMQEAFLTQSETAIDPDSAVQTFGGLATRLTEVLVELTITSRPHGAPRVGFTLVETGDLGEITPDDQALREIVRRAHGVDPEGGTLDVEQGLRDIYNRHAALHPDQPPEQPDQPQAPPSTIEGEQ